MIVREIDSNRQPLHDLHEVARGILGRQQREGLAGAHGETGDPALEFATTAVHVDLAAHPLADPQIGELGLLEVGVDPDLGERPDSHQVLPGLNVVAGIDVAPGDHAVDFGNDVAIAKVQLRLREVALGLGQLGFGLFDSRRIGNQLGVDSVEFARRVLLEEFSEGGFGRDVPGSRGIPELGRAVEQLPEGLAHAGEVVGQIRRDIAQVFAVRWSLEKPKADPDGDRSLAGPGRRPPRRPSPPGAGCRGLPC